ncbi:MAG: hypothetical protein Q8P92_03215 [Candidatus Daviesbacteria bacterium]|nr:hypothetical protein [Candidatus Daviesbacteria bacterium]
MSLNMEQSKSLAGFFFDVAKGLILGGLGLAVVTPFEVRLIMVFVSVFLAYTCLRIGLSLLEEVK